MNVLLTRLKRARKVRLESELEDKSVETYLLKLGALFATPKGFLASMIFGGIAYLAPIWMVVFVILIFVIVDFILNFSIFHEIQRLDLRVLCHEFKKKSKKLDFWSNPSFMVSILKWHPRCSRAFSNF